VRQSLEIIKTHLPEMKIEAIPSGEKVLDWEVPNEWNIREAWIKDPEGNKIVDFRQNNLHVMGYSVPVSETLTLDELKTKLYTIPEHPDFIPYRTSYYKPDWGFCITQNLLDTLKPGNYEVLIDSDIKPGVLNYGELYLPGETDQEFLLSCYICHPSMANDSLSGVGLLTEIAKSLKQKDNHYSYRFLFIPETIGSITWLAKNRNNVEKIKFGLVATCLGDPGSFTYKKSRQSTAEIDRISGYVLENSGYSYIIEDFFPFGSDERQYCSPGFNLPMGSLMRSRYSKFKEYHTSADNLDFITPKALGETFSIYMKVIEIAETNFKYKNLKPYGEPALGKRGLYKNERVQADFPRLQQAYIWVLNYSDESHDLLDIAEKSGLSYEIIADAAKVLESHELLNKQL
jgi:aminopeptidase-like protein